MQESRKSFAFVQCGEFSHTNRNTLEELRRQFPQLDADVIDVSSFRIVRKSNAARLLFEIIREHGPRAALSRKSFHRNIVLTRYFFREMRRQLLQRLSGKHYEFIFQTQSLFDASVPGTPSFVYTDHTHLTNLQYPDADRSNLAAEDWIELERSIYNNARATFTMSSNVSRTLIDQYGCAPSRVRCVYVGSNVRPEAEVSFEESRYARKRILFVGIDWERKGGPTLLEAFLRVRKLHPSAELTIVGAAPPIDIDGVNVIGRIPAGDVAAHYREASIFCLPTLVEPFGIVFLEAFAHGLPVVATQIGAIPDFVEPSRSGFLVKPRDTSALAHRLNLLLEDPALCARFARHGKELIDARYAWEATGARMASHIRSSLVARTPERRERVIEAKPLVDIAKSFAT